MDDFCGGKLLFDMVVEFFSVASCIAEDDGLFWPDLIYVFEQRFESIPAVDLQEVVVEVLRCGLFFIQTDSQRISKVFLGQLFNLFGHRSGKQKGLVLVYEAADDEFDV